eukprot:gene16961-20176_t
MASTYRKCEPTIIRYIGAVLDVLEDIDLCNRHYRFERPHSWVEEGVEERVPYVHGFPDFTYIVDVTECKLTKSNDYGRQRRLFSVKKQMCTAKYQVVVSVDGLVLDWSHHYGNAHDVTIFNQSGFVQSVDQYETGLGDKGYQGAPNLLTPFKEYANAPLTDDQ